jgi:thiamine biosynthesis lipoprotein
MACDLSRRKVLQLTGALALVPPLLSVISCDDGYGPSGATHFTGATMGTTYRVSITDLPADVDRRALKRGIDEVLARVDSRMSTWRRDSEVSLYNSAAPGIAIPVSQETAVVVTEALRVSRLSGGAFDPTLGPLVDLWGFGPAGRKHHSPRTRAIENARAETGARHVRILPGLTALTKAIPGLAVDLSSIAKGFAVDQVALYLEAQGLWHYLVEVGGELRAQGKSPRDLPWRVGIEKPVTGRRSVQRIVELGAASIATSGNYRNFYEEGGTVFSHLIDPRSGRPVEHALASVTVVAPSCMNADALSTALMVLGPEAGLALAQRQRIAAQFIVREGDRLVEVATSTFARYAHT